MSKMILLIYKTLKHTTSGIRLDFTVSIIGIIISLVVSIVTILFTYLSTNKQIIKTRQSTFDNNKYLELMKNMRSSFVQLNYAELDTYNILIMLRGRVKEYSDSITKIKKLKKVGKPEPLNIDLTNTDSLKRNIFNLHEKANSRVNKMDIYCGLINLNEKTVYNRDFDAVYKLVVKLMNNYVNENSMIKQIPDLKNTKPDGKNTSIGYFKETDINGTVIMFHNFLDMYLESTKYYNTLQLVSKELMKINNYKGNKTRNSKK